MDLEVSQGAPSSCSELGSVEGEEEEINQSLMIRPSVGRISLL